MFQYGQIVNSATAKIPVTGNVPYTVSGFSVSALQWVTGYYIAGNLYVLATLDNAWGLTQINANNLLPLATLNTSLLSAGCCAVNKAVINIENAETLCCTDKETEIETMLDLTDSISCIVPEGEIIGGKQAIYVWSIEALLLNTHNITVTIGNVTYLFTSSSTDNMSVVASEIASYINTFFPQNYPYQAQSFAENILVWGNNFDADNGTLVDATITDGAYNFFIIPKQLAFGTSKVLQGQNNITNNDLQLILNRLCSICQS